jgi:hypothetical protein
VRERVRARKRVSERDREEEGGRIIVIIAC